MLDRQMPLSDEFDATGHGSFEEKGYLRGFKSIAGLDEVGRGPLAGPVLAAAVVFPRGYRNTDIKDSKLLSASRREQLVTVIKRDAVGWAVGCVDTGEIDRINIFEASLLSMVRAYQALCLRPDYLLIDGDQKIPPPLFFSGGVTLESVPRQVTIVGGDRLCVSIAAASILAKVTRDGLMMELDASYPQYGFARHKGYACAAHLEALRRLGPSPIHRRSFKPVREMTDGQRGTQAGFAFSKGGL
jgi:ribonuclease HII